MRKVAILSIAVVGKILCLGRYLLRNKKLCFKIQKQLFLEQKVWQRLKICFILLSLIIVCNFAMRVITSIKLL